MNDSRVLFSLFGMIFAGFLLAACATNPFVDPAPIYTQAAQTIQADLSQTVEVSTPVPTATVTPSPTSRPTLTPFPTSTITRTPLPTFPPTITPLPTGTPTEVPSCNMAIFVGHVTLPPGTVMLPGTRDNKAWRLRNVGTCTWTRGYELVFMDGHQLGAQSSYFIPVNVSPGQTIDLFIPVNVPAVTGNYSGEWMLRSEDGLLFGTGGGALDPLVVSLKVTEVRGTYAFDFAVNYCLARWSSGVTSGLPCPGNEDSFNGFISLLDNPRLESTFENELTLWAFPNPVDGGYISGEYPAFFVREGDRFRAWVGCLYESAGCQVTFRLDYRIGDGPITTFSEWKEVYDEQITDINIDLSSLAGQNVEFALTVIGYGERPENNNAFWFVPRIVR
jgi:hypothetical protein